MSDHWYDETACDLLFGVVVDEEPEPPTRPLSAAVLQYLSSARLTNAHPVAPSSPGATPTQAPSGAPLPPLSAASTPSH